MHNDGPEPAGVVFATPPVGDVCCSPKLRSWVLVAPHNEVGNTGVSAISDAVTVRQGTLHHVSFDLRYNTFGPRAAMSLLLSVSTVPRVHIDFTGNEHLMGHGQSDIALLRAFISECNAKGGFSIRGL